MPPEDPSPSEDFLDDDAPLASLPREPRPATKSEAERILSATRAQPETHLPSNADLASNGNEANFQFLHSLLRRSVFYDYFVHVAHTRYAGRDPEPKVRKLIQDSRRFYRLMIALDVALRIAVAAVLTTAGTLVLLKTLWPLPWMQ